MTFRHALTTAAMTLLASTAVPAHAGEIKAVVELFTSQGCSSCPPADKVLEKLSAEDGILTLAHHVDYWNYLGWHDTLSSKDATNRQYGYAVTLHRKNVYTPQAIVNGRDHVVGSDEGGFRKMIRTLAPAGGDFAAPVSVTHMQGGISVSVGEGAGSGDVIAVYFHPRTTVEIERGENAGRTIRYTNSVTDVQTIGMWDGTSKTFSLPASVLSHGLSCAILVQKQGAGGEPAEIVGAAKCPDISS